MKGEAKHKRIWLKKGRIIDPDSQYEQEGDVLIEGGKIVDLGPRLAPDAPGPGERLIDAQGLWIVPGLVDIHTHLRDPGFEYKENIASGTSAAACGGFTSIVCLANTAPPNDNASITEYILNKAEREGKARVFPVGTVTRGLKGEELSEFGDLTNAGCVALSDDGKPVADSRIMRHALEYARNFSVPIISHCEDPQLFEGGCMNEGLVSTQLGLQGIPNACEEIMVARDVTLAGLTRGKLHLAHLSTRGSMQLLRQAKENGYNVTGEITPHHFTLTDEVLRDFDANCKMNPPLRTEEDRLALIKALKDGVIDAIASDHAPHSIDEKDVEFGHAPFGIIGLETTVPLTLKLVHSGELKPLEAVRLLTSGPVRALGLEGKGIGRLKKGGIADITLIDPKKDVLIDKNKSKSLSRNTPFHGWKLKGGVVFTILAGEVVHEC